MIYLLYFEKLQIKNWNLESLKSKSENNFAGTKKNKSKIVIESGVHYYVHVRNLNWLHTSPILFLH